MMTTLVCGYCGCEIECPRCKVRWTSSKAQGEDWLEMCRVYAFYRSLQHDYQRTGESAEAFRERVLAHGPRDAPDDV